MNLGLLLAEQPRREREAEAAYREAIAAGDTDTWSDLGNLLSDRPGREDEAEAAYREAMKAGAGAVGLGLLLTKLPGREREAEAAYREGMAAGDVHAAVNLGVLLAGQHGREREAEAAYRKALESGATGHFLDAAAARLGELLALRGTWQEPAPRLKCTFAPERSGWGASWLTRTSPRSRASERLSANVGRAALACP